jgi:hypothetical protein
MDPISMCPFFFMHIKECHYFILEKNSFISGKKDLKVLGRSFEGIFGMVELTLIASKERVLKPHRALTVFPWTVCDPCDNAPSSTHCPD